MITTTYDIDEDDFGNVRKYIQVQIEDTPICEVIAELGKLNQDDTVGCNYGGVFLDIESDASADEIEEYLLNKQLDDQRYKDYRQQQYLKLKAEFEPEW